MTREPKTTGGHELRYLVGVVAAVALLISACGSDDTATDDSTTTASVAGTDTTAGGETTTTASGSTTATTPAPSTTTPGSTSSPATTIPGEPFIGFAEDGDVMMVVGVAHDDVLNVREGPSTSYTILDAFDPTATDVVATGEAWLLDRSIWYGVDVGTTQGWVSSRYVAFEGAVDDVTSIVLDSLGERPVAETMLDLGTVVAEDRASSDVQSDIVVVVAPTVGDLGEITMDVVGLADDAAYGVRLHVFAEPLDDGEGFSLRSVEQTMLCGRGVANGGSCV